MKWQFCSLWQFLPKSLTPVSPSQKFVFSWAAYRRAVLNSGRHIYGWFYTEIKQILRHSIVAGFTQNPGVLECHSNIHPFFLQLFFKSIRFQGMLINKCNRFQDQRIFLFLSCTIYCDSLRNYFQFFLLNNLVELIDPLV